MSASRRVFVALELPGELRQRLVDLPKLVGTPDAKIRWVNLKQMHLTLFFAGEADDQQVEALREAVKTAGELYGALRIKVGELGAFPKRSNPRVIWVGIGENEELKRIQSSIAEAGQRAGLPAEERSFSPHLTLGRVKFVERHSPLLKRLQSVKVESFFYVFDTLTLFESKLTPDGPEHRALESVRLTSGLQ
ncbi:MAG: RNA 2',3'-cyclic phosphodiesterase [bacterium]